jgi:phosphatidate phosphatase LPIN
LVIPKIIGKDDSAPSGEEYKVLGTTEASLFCWSCHDVVVVSDIDGTVTQSDVRGVLDTIVTERFEYVHRGVCRLYTQLSQQPFSSGNISNKDKRIPKMHFLYLSSRPLSLINSTRKFITTLTQSSPPISSSDNHMIADGKDSFVPLNDLKLQLTKREVFKLPPGPIFCHTGSVVDVLKAELIDKTAHLFKSDVLRRQVIIPFVAAGKQPVRNPLETHQYCFANYFIF